MQRFNPATISPEEIHQSMTALRARYTALVAGLSPKEKARRAHEFKRREEVARIAAAYR